MSLVNSFSTEYLAISLHSRLDRRNIFPPLFNDPELYVPPAEDNFRKRRPPNPFLICKKNVHEEAKLKGSYNMRIITKATSIFWKNASLEEKNCYKTIAKRVADIYYGRKASFYKIITFQLLPPTPSNYSVETNPSFFPPTTSLYPSTVNNNYPISFNYTQIDPDQFVPPYNTFIFM
ncbi:hypothetical protein RhiirA5_373421 [Rhizophagus irregularis]|jgi:hypothetical protein|uniref:MATA-HMG n=3 Tax=Rhizophagus irregularis TaxID=588596 RepID=U9V064_RHIID|nr:hypothetical protein GLOIN_2v1521306 [Rhizophagus irregularis DAOM 181602=DAOM 197198]EXX57884.1 hypothetical protein RirG_203040 [Rhizophagus irregularis DAOM 197198w]PKC11999.1 hypothetical protein RhiirA5_373421 [Rhizophagus irregularis]PKC75725.1 hypothetical protein RhiirA1_387037 [Rhizophagus irregularis]PKY27329.1 hypothetical protein RhiirB3_390211 [Rhizophagus irregularis]PKY44330.1 hypothetical protein RhiirA4_458592 [Rhizophagus irregularis]|eukprot:XP_025186943.1 hypothetical protein GLOIN_2v1521306 [Rhizophagus irregularis DAOM 181602=DAOM 197198]